MRAGRDEDGRRARIRAEDARLFELARGSGRGRLALGEAAARLEAADGVAALGFSTRDAHAKERVSRTGRWVDEAARLARRLSVLPGIRGALLEGRIDWCMAELLARRATPETEAELLALALAPGVTVHAMRAYLQIEDEEEAAERDPARRRCTIEEVAPLEQGLFVEATRMLIEHLNGGSDFDWFEHLLAEGMSTVPELFRDDAMAELQAELRESSERVAEAIARRAEAEERAEPDLPEKGVQRGDFPEPEPLPEDATGLDGVMRRTALRLMSRDLSFGRAASDFFRSAAWMELGYASDTQYCRERLGMSRGAVWQRITLARRCEGLPMLAEAISSGDIGFEAAALVARVASGSTEEAWIERARVRTFKHLREEVREREAARRLGDETGPLWPPTEEQMREHDELEREVLSGERIGAVLDRLVAERDGQAEIWTGGADGEGSGEGQGPSEPIQISATPGDGATEDGELGEEMGEALVAVAAEGAGRRKGEVTIRIRTNEEVARYYRAARVRYRQLGRSSTLLMALCTWFWETWIGEVRAERTKYDAIHRRDRWQCASPGCTRRLCTLHHIVWRMFGGDERWTNLLTLCEKCHLDNVHEKGSLKVSGEAPYGLTFVFGTDPLLTVRGREKRAA